MRHCAQLTFSFTQTLFYIDKPRHKVAQALWSGGQVWYNSINESGLNFRIIENVPKRADKNSLKDNPKEKFFLKLSFCSPEENLRK